MNIKTKSIRGLLIACEGVSGSGKTENINQIFNLVKKNKNNRCFLFEWNSNPLVRKLINELNKLHLLTPTIYSILQWIGFLTDYLFIILPRLLADYIVIADRYIYTGLTRDASNGASKRIGWIIYHLVRKPDLLVFHDTDSNLCYERIKTRGKKLFYPNPIILNNRLLKNKDLYYLRKIRREYLKLFTNPAILEYTRLVFIEELDPDILVKLRFILKQKLGEDYSATSLIEEAV